MIAIQAISIPEDCRILHHDFYDYEPNESFDLLNNVKYLNENLFQCVFPEQHLKIDVGWYGDVVKNEGEFRIQIIVNENWEHSFNVIYSKSANEVKGLLLNIFKYYSSQEFDAS